MVNKLNALDWIALILVVIGGLNWGLVGAFDFDLVDAILGTWPVVVRVVYVIVGIAALYLIAVLPKFARK